jgi:hypothetical protein
MELENLLKGSFPKPGDQDRIRSLFEKDIGDRQNALGVAPRRELDAIWITYPVTVFAWRNVSSSSADSKAAISGAQKIV